MPTILSDTPFGYVEMEHGEILTGDCAYLPSYESPGSDGWLLYRTSTNQYVREDIGRPLGIGFARHIRPETHEEFLARGGDSRLPVPPPGWTWLHPHDVIPYGALLFYVNHTGCLSNPMPESELGRLWDYARGVSGSPVANFSYAVLVPAGTPRTGARLSGEPRLPANPFQADTRLATRAPERVEPVSTRPPRGARRSTFTVLPLP